MVMTIRFFNKTEIILFFSFFALFLIFMHWNGWIENSRLFLTKAIVEEGRFEIDTFANQTSDRSNFNNHYYSDKEPGTSFIAAVPYAILKIIFKFQNQSQTSQNLIPLYITNVVNKIEIYDYLNLNYFWFYSMIIATIFTSVLFSALSILIIYKITGIFTKNSFNRLLVTLSAGLATTIFPYAQVFTDNGVSIFFTLTGFYLLLKIKYKKIYLKKYALFSGLLFGLAVLTSAITVILLLLALCYLFSFKKNYLPFFILGCVLTGSIFVIYNYIVFKTPITLPIYFVDQTIFETKRAFFPRFVFLQFIPKPQIIWRLWLDSYKGIFFYYPVLLFGLYGLFLMRKKYVAEMLFIISTFILISIVNSALLQWWGGGFFSLRNMTHSIPFLIIPSIFVLNKKKKYLTILFLLLFAYSTFVNIAGLQPPANEIIGADRIHIDKKYEEKINSYEFLLNPIYDYYIPKFFENGPRSKILETFSDCNNAWLIDIRQTIPIYPENCTKPIEANAEIFVSKEAVGSGIEFCACSMFAGGDGAIFSIFVDNKNISTIHIDSLECKSEIIKNVFNSSKSYKITLVP